MGNFLQVPVYQHVIRGIAGYLDLLDEEERAIEPPTKRARLLGNRHRNRGYALNEVDCLSEADFRKMFRMTREGFEELLTLVSPHLHQPNQRMASVSSGSHITQRTKLFVTLRYLAGASYLDLIFAWGISKAAFFSSDPVKGVLWPTMEAIDHVLHIGLPVNDEAKLEEISQEFSTYSNGQLRGCVTAIDGWVAQTRKPSRDEVRDIMSFRNRHDCWGLVVLAGCDARCYFTMFSCINSGSTNDSTAWEASAMKRLLEAGRLPGRFFLIGDEAFSCTNQLLVPWPGRGIGVWKDSFNYHLSAMRQCIERAFALLVQRWGVLWRPLRSQFSRWTLVLTVCAKLHNYCLDRNIPLSRHRFEEDIEDADEPAVLLNQDDPEEQQQLVGGGAANKRTAFTRGLQDLGVRRPLFAQINSRA